MDNKVFLKGMTETEFERYVEWFIEDYSSDLIKSGRSNKENARNDAKNALERLLPQGLETKNNFIFTIVNDIAENIGVMWYKRDKDCGFIYDFIIHEQFRRKGYGCEALYEIEKEAKKNDISQICLHVFEFNKSAISLYNKIGYIVIEQDESGKLMKKYID